MKILFLASSERWGGAEKALVALARGAKARGHTVALAAPPRVPLSRDAEQAGVPLARFHLGRKLSRRTAAEFVLRYRMQRAAAKRFLLEEAAAGTEVLHVQFKRDQLVASALARSAGLAVVWTEHGPLPAPFARAPLRVLYRRAAHQAARIMAVSNATAADIAAAGVPTERIRVVPNGVDVAAIVHGARRAETRASLGIDPDEIVIAYFGRVTAAKGAEVLRAAWSSAPASGRRLLIAGDGPLLPAFARVTGALAVGRRTDVPALLSAADIVVSPSVEPEGMPLAILEAMAAGRAVVASDVGGTAEAIGECGLLVPAGDAARLAEAIASLSADRSKRESLGRAAAERARVHFDQGSAIDAALAVFAEAVAERHARAGGPR